MLYQKWKNTQFMGLADLNIPEPLSFCAHTLKGVSANLGFQRLLRSVSQLTELLRPQGQTIPQEAAGLLEQVRQDYELTVSAIRAYLASENQA